MQSTINDIEIQKFSALSEKWWDDTGPFQMLHKINPIRIEYIRNIMIKHYGKVEGKTILDIGCGGGLVAEPLARQGGIVTAIDASKENIEAAKQHAKSNNIHVDYICATPEKIQQHKFDVVLALEVIEHVDNIELFIESCKKLMNPGGLLIVSTLNRTIASFFKAIVAAEYILNWVDKGTHDWHKFFTPQELKKYLADVGLKVKETKGMNYSVIQDKWYLSDSYDTNYFMYITN